MRKFWQQVVAWWRACWTWYVLRFWVTRTAAVPLMHGAWYCWPVFVRASFKRHHKVRAQ